MEEKVIKQIRDEMIGNHYAVFINGELIRLCKTKKEALEE